MNATNKTMKDVMTHNPTCCDASTPITDVARMMRENDVGDVIVTKDGKICGILTDRDIVVRCVADGGLDSATAEDICSEHITRLSPDDKLEHAVKLMAKKAIRRLPITDDGEVVGVVSIGDLALAIDPRSALGSISRASPNN